MSSRRSEEYTGSNLSLATSSTSDVSLPWIRRPTEEDKQDATSTTTIPLDTNVKPGQYVLQSLFAEFTIQAERKIERIMTEPLESPLAKLLQRGEDQQFDQLLSSLSAVAEHCLPSLLKTLFDWYSLQNEEDGTQRQKVATKNKGEKDYLSERRDLAVDFLFCLVLIEVLKQLPLHPVPDNMISHIETLAFRHFKSREGLQSGVNTENIHIIADLYAEVLGVMAQTRFLSVRKRFFTELKELRSEPQNVQTTQSIISLVMGLKFYRVKMFPVEDFESSFQLLHECANYYLEVKDKDIKHALAGLLVEILVPIAALPPTQIHVASSGIPVCVKNEVNIPVLKNFVEKMYQTTFEQCSKKKHALAAFPLLTCLLCVSQKQFFLSTWHNFLSLCLSSLKHRDSKLSRVALESLYRLLWVYIMRIQCESNTSTTMRLQSITGTLFPRNSRNVIPRDTPLHIFVKIIQFIAQEKLEFAVRDVIFDLLGVTGKSRMLFPERMNVGLRAFLVIADSLQQKEEAPPMPTTTRIMPSGNTLRTRKTFLNKQLTEDGAKTIGVAPFYPSIRKALDHIVRSLDIAVGKALLMTNAQCLTKELDDLMTNERKPKIELFRTCIAAIPRLIPDGLSRKELLELLSRLTVHRDDELRGLAFTSLQNVVVDLPDWREDVIICFVNFMVHEVHDMFPLILESALKMLLQLLSQWKMAETNKEEEPQLKPPYERNPFAGVLNLVEGFALVFLCSCRPLIRRLSFFVLKEVRALFSILGYSRVDDDSVLDVIDRACPGVVESFIHQLPPAEKATITALPTVDLQWVVERSINQWSGSTYESSGASDSLTKLAARGMGGFNPWASCLARFFHSNCLPHYCPTAVTNAWPVVNTRLTQLYGHIDPSAPSEGRTSIRSKKVLHPMDDNIALWRNYLVFACSCAPPSAGYQTPRRCLSPEPNSGSNDGSSHLERLEARLHSSSSGVTAATLFKMLVPLIRCDNTDTREAVVNGLGWTNMFAFRDLMDELQQSLKDALERKQENMRRKRRRDFLRVHLIRVFELIAEHGLFRERCLLGKETQPLNSTFIDYIEGMRLFLESESDKDSPTLMEIRLHFSGFIGRLIRSVPAEHRANLLPRDVRYSVFFLCGAWCRKLGVVYGAVDRTPSYQDENFSDLEIEALQAMAALLVCGEVFDTNALAQEGYLYTWMDNLLNCTDERVHKLGKETAVLLLENNPQLPMVLMWFIHRCYTGPKLVASGYFQAMASVLNTSEYPCDMIVILCLVLLKTADPCSVIRTLAYQLLQVLDKRFFGSGGQGNLLKATYGKSHVALSRELANLHPELTLAIFSEITERFESAPLVHRNIMLEYLLPWIYNIELVDSLGKEGGGAGSMGGGKEKEVVEMEDPEQGCALRRPGWGSKQASCVILNNLLFITAEYGDEHCDGLEQLWAGLCTCWPGNLPVILNFLLGLTGVMTNPNLLPYLKRVLVYIARAKPQRLMDELMREMLSVEIVTTNVERTEEPPFFQLYHQPQFGATGPESGSAASLIEKMDKEEEARMLASEKGKQEKNTSDRGTQVAVGTKTPPPTDGGSSKDKDSIIRYNEGSSLHQSSGSLSTLTSSTSTPSNESAGTDRVRFKPAIPEEPEESNGFTTIEEKASENFQGSTKVDFYAVWQQQTMNGLTLPIPLPEEYYCAPLSDYIDDNETPPQGVIHRCNLATVLLTDLVLEKVDVDWQVHLPHILHDLFLGLDHSWPLVHEHCKRLLLNLLVKLAPHNDFVNVAHTLLSRHVISDLNAGLLDQKVVTKEYNFTGGPTSHNGHTPDTISYESDNSALMGSTTTISGASTVSVSSMSSTSTVIPFGMSAVTHISVDHLRTSEEAAKALIEFLVTRKCRPLWSCEEITPRLTIIKSAEQLETFLRNVVRIFHGSLRGSHLEQRWAQVALQLALSCSSRHYAGRSFQMFRALNPPLNPMMLSNIMTRLVETVADQGEDVQGYATEILLTLENSIDTLAQDLIFADLRERSKSGSSRKAEFRKSTSNLFSIGPTSNFEGIRPKIMEGPNSVNSPGNNNADMRAYVEHRGRSSTTSELDKSSFHRGRARSSSSLKHIGENNIFEERLNMLAQVFWIFVSLLESDYEFEFLMALKALEKLLRYLPLDRPEVRVRLDQVLAQLRWEGYPGLQALILKGFTSSVTYDLTLHLVSKLTTYTHLRVIDPTQAAGFPLNVVALLPYLIQKFGQPEKFACEIATNISRVCQERCTKMAPLSTVLTMYKNGTYNRDSKAWAGVVCKYLHGAYSHFSIPMMTFLIEVLEKGPINNQSPVLQIVYHLIHNIDLMAAPMQQVNDNLLRVIAKYVQGVHWQDSLNILKVAVSKSSSLVKPPSHSDHHNRVVSLALDQRKELPGRTMEFTFDLSRVVDPEHTSSSLPETSLLSSEKMVKKEHSPTGFLTRSSKDKTPIIRRKYPSMATITTSFSDESAASTLSSDDSSMSTEPTDMSQLGPGGSMFSASSATINAAKQNIVPSAWRKPQQSQRRTRERMVSVLKGLGQNVGLPRSPSVIFSSTSDITNDRQTSVCSSSDSTSIVDSMNPEGSKAEESGDIPTLKEFDFEGEEVDREDGKGFNWYDSRHSLEDIDSSGVTNPDHEGSKYSSEDETSISGADDNAPSLENSRIYSGMSQEFIPSPGGSSVIRRTASGSLSSGGSDIDSITSPICNSPTANSSFIYIPVDEVEEAWQSHVDAVMGDTSGRFAVNTFHIFTQLYKVMQQRFCNLTREACNYLGDRMRSIALQFLNTLEVLSTHALCPFVYVDTETLMMCRLLDSHKYCVLELNEHYDTYISKRDLTVECLDSIKASLKRQTLVAHDINGPTGEEQQIELCRRLYRLYCQLRMLFDSYCKLIHSLEGAKHGPHASHIVDFSVFVCAAKEELSLAAQELESGQVALSPEGDTGITTPEAAVVTLTNHLGRRDVRRALRILHVYRSMWSGELFGSSEEDDQDVLLALLCKQLADGRSGVLVISRSGQELQTACHKLMDINAQLKKSIKVIENLETKEEVEEKSEVEKAEGEGPGRGDEKVKMRRKGNRKGKNDGRKSWKSEGDRSSKEGSGEAGQGVKGGRGNDEKKKGKEDKKGKQEKKRSSKELTPETTGTEEKKLSEERNDGKGKDGEGEDSEVVVMVTSDSGVGGDVETKEAKIVFQSNEGVESEGVEGREVTLDTKGSTENMEEVKVEDMTLKDATGGKADGEGVEGGSETRTIDEEEVESDLTALIEAIEEIEEEMVNKDKMEALPLKLTDDENTSTGAAGAGVEPSSPAKGESFAPLPDMDSGVMAETPDSQAPDNKTSFTDDVPLDIQVTPAEEDKLFPPDKEPLRKGSTGETENETEKKALGITEDVWQKDPNSRPTSGESLCTEL
ncbi:protein furry homolog isoform X2 [Lytechinus variegatus]|uniref:protein furry homolog isoform X2 n=1 Tax=Lytechinus variegatus TaxID=7654 RepID=UPI001BB0E22D|nr:protein furry homolog isoform X2 [Lytechinus variegatus]